MRAKALEIGITGCIQRYLHRDVVFYYEGTAAQVDELFAFLRMCEAQEMIQTIEYGEERELRVRRHGNFRIITDHSRTVERRGQVIKGQYSDEEQYDKLSEYSSSSQKLLGSFGNF